MSDEVVMIAEDCLDDLLGRLNGHPLCPCAIIPPQQDDKAAAAIKVALGRLARSAAPE